MATVTFLGACGTVTGSSTLLTWGERKILVDCGLYQGDEELEARNRHPFPFRPSEISAVIATHAHLDHTGLLPRLVAQGFKGPIYCTKPSRGLISLVLQDAAAIQEEEARYARRKGYSRHADPKPLYSTEDAKRALRQLETKPFDEVVEIAPGIRFRYVRAGHLLGAASVEVTAKGSDGEARTWLFSGDVGRYGVPILKDPEPATTAPAALLLESTYGDRHHPIEDPRERLAQIVETTFGRGGSVILPTFALGRTQELLYHLTALADQRKLDPSAVFVDSPMAIDATDIYSRSEGEHDEELVARIDQGLDPFEEGRFVRCRTVDQSKALNARREPAVILAGSGMANGGRVLHHFAHHLGNPADSIVFVGFQAAGTRGAALVGGADTVAIHGQTAIVRAQIHQLHSLSAHADQGELLRWCRALPAPPERVFLNHGEDPPRRALAAKIVEDLGWPRPIQPITGDSFPW